MYDDWDMMDSKDFNKVGQIYHYCLKEMFKHYKFRAIERNVYSVSEREDISVDIYATTIALTYHYRDSLGRPSDLWLHRYALYPMIIPCYSYIRAPNPIWGLGLIESIIVKFKSKLLDSLCQKDSDFKDMENDMKIALEKLKAERLGKVFKDSDRIKEIEEMKRIKFEKTRLTFENYKTEILKVIKE